MNKKDLKFYEAPACEVMEMELQAPLLADSDNPFSGSTYETEEGE